MRSGCCPLQALAPTRFADTATNYVLARAANNLADYRGCQVRDDEKAHLTLMSSAPEHRTLNLAGPADGEIVPPRRLIRLLLRPILILRRRSMPRQQHAAIQASL